MGRVETRMYKRKQRRLQVCRRWLIAAALLAAAGILWRTGRVDFIAERVGLSTPAPLTESSDRTTESREVTLPEETWYAIQTGVFSTEEAALQKADAYASRGAPGTVVQDGAKWRVFIACYGSEADASAVRTRLEQNQKVETYLYPWKCPELRLRLTGMVGQLDVVEAGFTLLTSTAAALRETATALVAALLTLGEGCAVLADLEEQIALWQTTLRERFGRSIPALGESMLSLTSQWVSACAALRRVEDITGLSAGLKAEAMAMYDGVIAWRSDLSAP